MFKGPGKIVRDNKSSSYPVFELTGVNCISIPTSYLKQAALDNCEDIYSGLPYLSQESMVLSQLLILSWAFSHSLTKLQNCSFCESLIRSFEVPKCEKTTTTK